MENAVLERDNTMDMEVKDHSAVLDKLVVLQSKLDVLDKLSKDSKLSKEEKSEHFMIGQLYKLMTTMLGCDQSNLKTDTYFATTKVNRIYRYIPNAILDYNKQDRIIAGGLFLEVPVYIISGEIIKKATKNRYGSVIHPEEFGLPSHSEANYSTLINAGGGYYQVLRKGTWLDDWLKLSRNWEYVNMD